ncbi:MAG: NADP-dependent oxidoreductase [Hyphomicrobiaceae bacterium]
MSQNRIVRLIARPKPGLFTPDVFEIADEPVSDPEPGEFRVRIQYVSLDPAMRGWVNEGRSYVPPVALGDVMRAYAVGHVDASRHPNFREGDAVQGLFGAQRYAISNGTRVQKVDERLAPLQSWVGGLGMPGWTAYFGLLEIGKPKAGETVVVSAASGAVGSVVGQIAKIQGCRVVGIAGGAEKCDYVTRELGFDAAVDHRAGNLSEHLRGACPDGIDVDFENVGGPIFDTVLGQMNTFGRVALCGLISAYSATTPPPALTNYRAVLTQRLVVQGLIVFDWAHRTQEAIDALGTWYKEGRLKIREDVRSGGLDAFPDVVNLLYSGANQGKLVLAIDT